MLIAQFAYNSSTTETTLVTLFYANLSYTLEAYREPGITNIDNKRACVHVKNLADLHVKLSKELRFVAERNAYYYNKKRSQELTLVLGDRVYLLRTNIKTARQSSKLDYKMLGPFKIIRVVPLLNYKLALLKTINIHLVFYISLL